MPPPPDVPNDYFVDAVAMAGVGSAVDRSFADADLPRLSEVAAGASVVRARLRFSQFDGRPAIDGRVQARVTLTCQRCMGPVDVEIEDDVHVLIVAEERADEPGGYEPVVADAARLDLRWLVEDQLLLALPLVPKHDDEQCSAIEQDDQDAAVTDEEVEPPSVQKPFQNLRDMMRKR
jgi:uncharacterized protein